MCFYVCTAAAVLRKVYLRQGVGLTALRRMFGGAQRRGVMRQKTVLGAGGVIRHVLQQFEVSNAVGVVIIGGREIVVVF